MYPLIQETRIISKELLLLKISLSSRVLSKIVEMTINGNILGMIFKKQRINASIPDSATVFEFNKKATNMYNVTNNRITFFAL